MTIVCTSSALSFDLSPHGRLAFWARIGLLLGLVLITTVAIYVNVRMAMQAQAAENNLLQQQISKSDHALAETKRIQDKTAAGLNRLRVIEIAQQQQADDTRLLHFLSQDMPPGIQLFKLNRNGSTLQLQGSAATRSQITLLMRRLEISALTDTPVLLELVHQQTEKPSYGFKISARALAAETPDNADANPSQPQRDVTRSSAATEPQQTEPNIFATAELVFGLLTAVAALGYAIWRGWYRVDPLRAARLYAAMATLDPRQIGTWPRAARLLALAELGLFAAFAAWLWVIAPAVAERESYQQHQLQLQEALRAKEQVTAMQDADRARLVAIEDQLATQAQRLPLHEDQEKLRAAIEQLARTHNLKMATPQAALRLVQEQFYASRKLSLQLTGSLDAIGGFVSQLAEIPQLVLLGDFDLTPLETTHGLRFDATLNALLASEPAAAKGEKS